MKRFWRWHIQFRTARALVHLGLWIWPEGPAKDEVMGLLHGWAAKVYATNAITRAQAAAAASRS